MAGNSSNVILIDPNLVNSNATITNGIPQYQDMYIFAELTAVRKKRTVLTKGVDTKKYTADSGDGQFTFVNFMGNNQNQDSPNNFKFTTNYYDGSNYGNTQYEGFGISSINVKVNSSYIPQVNIQFIDTRGLAFFNQANSPYKMIFDFPPPIFNLKLKGYYGKALEYQLHLVKYTTEFRAENGNYVIDAQFVAITYAPLTDVLFRYVVNFPLINSSVSVNSNANEKPSNTYELILKLKSLYSQSSELLNSDTDAKVYKNTLNSINSVVELMGYFNAYKENPTLKGGGIPLLFMKNQSYISEGVNELTLLENVTDYDTYIKTLPTDGQPDSLSQRLCIGFLVNENIKTTPNEAVVIDQTGAQVQDIIPKFTPANINSYTIKEPDKNAYHVKDVILSKYRTELINAAKNRGVNDMLDTDIPASTFLNSDENIVNSTNGLTNRYVIVDVTKYYVRLYKLKNNLQNTKNESMSVFNEKINNMVIENLGMKPTIYNIFDVILKDVDIFFRTLLTTSKQAEEHHNTYKNKIANGNLQDIGSDKNDKIFSFPLIIKQQKVCNQMSEVRAAPIEFNLSCKFPEIDLVEKFIATFTKQLKITEQFNARGAQNEDGTFKWIPISPVDSTLATGNLLTPYYGVDNSNGGSASQPINLSEDKRLVQVFKKFLPRFYILSQNSLADGFYGGDKKDLVLMYAKAEGVNLVASIINTEYTDLLLDASTAYLKDIQSFYTYLIGNVKDDYDFENKESFRISSNGNDMYVNRDNTEYVGFSTYNGDVVLQSPDNKSDSLISKFQKDIALSAWKKFLRIIGIVDDANIENYYSFTQENVFYIKDASPKADTVMNTTDIQSRYIAEYGVLYDKLGFTSFPELIDKLDVLGNKGFEKILKIKSYGDAKTLNAFGNFLQVWSYELGYSDTDMYDIIINNESDKFNPKLSAIILLSNFGHTLSPFNIYPHALNEKIFDIPAGVEIPPYLSPYIGSLVGIEEGDSDYKMIYDFFVGGAGNKIGTKGAFIFADIHDINKYLSSKDKIEFQQQFNAFYKGVGTTIQGSDYYGIVTSLNSLYKVANTKKDNVSPTVEEKINIYYKELSNDGNYFNTITEKLMKRVVLLNYNQITFDMKETETQYYDSLSKTNADTNKGTVNDMFFKEFFGEISRSIGQKKNDLIAQDNETKKNIGDEDIITQTYYSFKNINDKWLTSPRNDNGYPNIENGSKLIDSFAFVDRAMKPIGDTIINPEMLIDMLEDDSISVYTVLSQLLSVNGFEFFPLQNFMSYEINEWEDSFKIDTGRIVTQTPTFVCMYIGGGSSYPTGIGLQGQFKDDGIVDISNPGTNDFNEYKEGQEGCYPVPTDDNQLETNTKFKFGQVRAFKVRFGEQNQSMFTDIKIDSKEYPETNESIQILSRLAGDNKLQAPVPKGQNLYNLYENRSYKATVTGLGNMMIQPTQYFQLENVPLFNGAYIILGVEHNIIPNKMTTSFYGTKILKYPIPRVLQSSSIMGFEGGNSDNTSIALSTEEEVLMGVGTASNPPQAQFNSMYTFKI